MTRAAILDATLAVATEHGWPAASMQAVRERAGVSNGSLFHHFPTRAALEAGVLGAGLAEHQQVVLEVLAAAPDAREGVTGVVRAELAWLARRPALAELFLTAAPAALRAGADPATVTASRAFFTDIGTWIATHGWTGEPDLPVVIALWTGPARAWARLAGPDDAVAEVFADAAWRTLAPVLGR